MRADRVWEGLKDVMRVGAGSSLVLSVTDSSSRLNPVRDPYRNGPFQGRQ